MSQDPCRVDALLGLCSICSLGGVCGFSWLCGSGRCCSYNCRGRLQCRTLVLQRIDVGRDLGLALIEFDQTGVDLCNGLCSLGASPVEWAFKIECCGAGLTLAQQPLVEELTHKITTNAIANGADAFVVACPLCHTNLDMRQEGMRKRFGDVKPMPVYYISELVAIACGAKPSDVAVGKHFVPALDLVSKL